MVEWGVKGEGDMDCCLYLEELGIWGWCMDGVDKVGDIGLDDVF